MTGTILDKFNLSGRTALITGGAGLLGKQFGLALAQAGASVFLADLNFDAADEQALALRAQGLQASAVRLDVLQPESCQAVVAHAVLETGRLDILVNSAALDPKFDPEHAGEQAANAFEDYSLDSWRQALDVNLTGMFLVTQAAVKPMREQGKGSIVNICSTYGLNGPDQRIYERPDGSRSFKPVYYSVTKAGVLGFTRYLAAYYANTQLRVNALTPGGVYNGHDEVFTQAYSAKTILGRMANLDEMSAAMLFLCSDASSYMTGGGRRLDGMVIQPKVLALIPARGGSKGIPRKNIKLFAGAPLIAWSIAAAKESKYVTRLIVSTDDEEIAQVARDWGAEAPFLRPAEFAQDDSTDLPVFEHALAWLKEHEPDLPHPAARFDRPGG